MDIRTVFVEVLEGISGCLCAFSVFILVWGVILCAIRFVRLQFSHRASTQGLMELTRDKNALGVYVLLSLEILIAADIIDSIAKPTWEDILRLGAIVAIRTVISYFLNKEIQEGEEMLHRNK